MDGDRPSDTGGLFDAAFVLGPRGAETPFHSLPDARRTLIVFAGSVQVWLPGQSRVLTAGDSAHAPAGTVHSFAIGAHNTQMLGQLTSHVFEPFFDVTGVPTEDDVHTEGLIDPSVVMGGMVANPGLDVTVVGPPPARTRAPGL